MIVIFIVCVCYGFCVDAYVDEGADYIHETILYIVMILCLWQCLAVVKCHIWSY